MFWHIELHLKDCDANSQWRLIQLVRNWLTSRIYFLLLMWRPLYWWYVSTSIKDFITLRSALFPVSLKPNSPAPSFLFFLSFFFIKKIDLNRFEAIFFPLFHKVSIMSNPPHQNFKIIEQFFRVIYTPLS
jgi:hypothetical protein